MRVTYEQIRRDEAVKVYIAQADASLNALGFTEHSFAHVSRVASAAGEILRALDYPARTVELAQIAGYLHDIGNVVNRIDHSQSGAVMAFRILDRMNFPPEEIAAIVTAIGNHDEGTGVPVNALSAALIIADKSDVRRSRVRRKEDIVSDIHDRVNYSVTDSELDIDREGKTITLILTVDTSVSSVMEYFEIFMKRMLLCRKAAERLGLTFKLRVNDQILV
ncbi:MAG: HD domain-containing protein [Oscillospiraceae bacterium]|nr:HD domain-containing protein [Oscillospiraceae bacterium]